MRDLKLKLRDLKVSYTLRSRVTWGKGRPKDRDEDVEDKTREV